MDLTLSRTGIGLYGIFGRLTLPDEGEQIAVTLEHAYPIPAIPRFAAKILPGVYTCKRGTHQLHGKNPFETFEIMRVKGCTGILFHQGNYNKDSEGCILLGSSLGVGCILDSKVAFEKFMELQKGVDSFKLVVEG